VAIASQTAVYLASFPQPPPGMGLLCRGAWQDLQGAVRFTILSGSVTIESFKAQAIRHDVDGWNGYSSVVVPEPGVLPLLCAFVAAGLVWRVRVSGLSLAAQLSRCTRRRDGALLHIGRQSCGASERGR
jgi:hypothetical protein